MPGSQCGEIGLGRTHRVGDPTGVSKETFAGVGERDLACSHPAVEESDARGTLECGDLMADRRLRVAEPPPGCRERAGLDDRLERREVANLDAEQIMTVFDLFFH